MRQSGKLSPKTLRHKKPFQIVLEGASDAEDDRHFRSNQMTPHIGNENQSLLAEEERSKPAESGARTIERQHRYQKKQSSSKKMITRQ